MTEESRLTVRRSRWRVGTGVQARPSVVRALLIVGAMLFTGVLTGVPGLGAASEGTLMTLAEAIRIGLEQDPTLRQAEIELEIARLELNAEISTFLLPTVDLDLSPPNLTTDGWAGTFSGTLSAGLSLPIGTSSQLSGKLNIDWDPATGSWSAEGWNVSYSQRLSVAQSDTATDAIDRHRQSVVDAEAALVQAQTDLVVNVSRSYSRLLSATALLEQAGLALAEAKQALDQTQADFEAGLVGEITLVKARIALLDSEITVEDRIADLAESQEQLFGETLGLPGAVELGPPDFALDAMVAAAGALLDDLEAISAAVASSSAVENAEASLTEAEGTLSRSRLGIDPDMTVQAGLSDKGFSVGWSVSFTLFAPTWSEEIDIARLRVKLAEQRLRSAMRQAESSIRSSQTDLKAALRDVELLPLEEERWVLEEQVMHTKLDAGSISQDDWSKFLEQLGAFQRDANERSITLFIALLEYRTALGLPLGWEEWLE